MTRMGENLQKAAIPKSFVFLLTRTISHLVEAPRYFTR